MIAINPKEILLKIKRKISNLSFHKIYIKAEKRTKSETKKMFFFLLIGCFELNEQQIILHGVIFDHRNFLRKK